MTDIFGSLFYLTNRFQTIIDRNFIKYDLTTKQWFLIAVIGRFFDAPPNLIDVAELMGSSYQNVKQLALKLEQKGYVTLKRDEKDKRALRISLTNKCEEFGKSHQDENYEFFVQLFQDFDSSEITQLLKLLNKLTDRAKRIE